MADGAWQDHRGDDKQREHEEMGGFGGGCHPTCAGTDRLSPKVFGVSSLGALCIYAAASCWVLLAEAL